MDGAAGAPKVNADGAAAAGVVEAGVEVPKVVVVEGPQVTMISIWRGRGFYNVTKNVTILDV